MTRLSPFWTALVFALAQAVIGVLATNSGHGSVALAVNVVIAVLAALHVYLAANGAGETWSGWRYIKPLVAGLSAAAALLATYLTHGSFGAITQAEWFQVAFAFLSALGVLTVPAVLGVSRTSRPFPSAVP